MIRMIHTFVCAHPCVNKERALSLSKLHFPEIENIFFTGVFAFIFSNTHTKKRRGEN